jgi:hypothetical protein
MSLIKLIYEFNPKLSLNDFFESFELYENGSKWSLTDKSRPTKTPASLVFVVNDCRIKYMPVKFDKITLTLPDSVVLFFEKFYDHCNALVPIEPLLKDQNISFKLSSEMKQKCQNELKLGDACNIVIKFNNIWTINKKTYISFELIQFQKIEQKVKQVNYFAYDFDC